MADIRFTELPDASAITGSELQPLSQLSTTTTLTATTISASSVGNVLADSGNGFVTAGFAANQQVRISGYTGGGVANNLTATIVSVSAGLLYVDVPLTSVAAGDTVTITRWLSRKATPATVQAGAINTATGKATPVDADALGITDSAAGGILKKLTWANLKAALKAITDTLYAAIGAITGSGLTMATGKLLGRSTASTGAVEEITVGSGLSLSAGTLSSTALGDVVGPASATANAFALFDGTTGKLLKDSAVTISTDGTLASNSDAKVSTEKAVKAYVDAIVTGGASDVMIFKGLIDASANPNYPAADAGNVYKISVAGRIGGGSGPQVEVGDTIYCITDSTAAGNHATVGANWVISQVNIDGAVVGPASATDGGIVLFDGTTGKIIKLGTLTQLLDLVGSAAQGDILYRNGSAWVRLAAGTSGQYLKTFGAAANPAWASFSFSVGFGFTTTPTASEVLLLYTFAEAVTFPDEWSGSVGDIGTNPTASFVLDVQKNGSSVGTVTISTGGAFTFVTTGGTVAFAIGDQLKVVGPGSADATAANVSITFLGAK